MDESIAIRLKFDVLNRVKEALRRSHPASAESLYSEFSKRYEEGLEEHGFNDAPETTQLMALLRELKPSLQQIIGQSEECDMVIADVSAMLNSAIAAHEDSQMIKKLMKQSRTKRQAPPKSVFIQRDGMSNNLELLSVGIDVGSSTTHLILSRLKLGRERSFANPTNRFQVQEREIIYESDIIFTPLLDSNTIDIEAIVAFCKSEYAKAGVSPDAIDTGAVVVTGETAKKQNAEEIANRLSLESGRFVSATAGPNYESVLAAMGSGAIELSKEKHESILNVDIGGGTSNLALVVNGRVHATSCINVGGRLLGIDKDSRVWRVDEPARLVMSNLGLDYNVGDLIPESEARKIAATFASALIEVIEGPARTVVARQLMMTEDMRSSIQFDAISFSGGVGELIYRNEGMFDDIGNYLADEIRNLVMKKGWRIVEPISKIRATVIGAGSFTLSVSGATCYFDKGIVFPLRNIPVAPLNVTNENYRPGIVEREIAKAFQRYDMIEGEDLLALYFPSPLFRSYTWLQEFVKAIERALPNSIKKRKMIILLFESDVGRMVGLMARRETSIQHNLICLDELQLEEGDWIDIGAPFKETQSFPVTIKSLVFYRE